MNGHVGVDAGSFDSGREPGSVESVLPVARRRLCVAADVDAGFTSMPQTLRLVVVGQVASTAMPGTLQMGLGGPGRVLAYDRSTASVDDGIYVGLDFRMTPDGGRAGDFLCSPTARTVKSNVSSPTMCRWASRVSVSVGICRSVPGSVRRIAHQFDAQLRFSVPVADKGSQDWINDDGVTLYWMLRYVP